MRTSSRNVTVLLFDEVELLDVAGPLEVFATAGRQWNWRPFRALVAADVPRLVETRNQTRIEARYGLAECPDPEIILVPGGYGARRREATQPHVDWLREKAPGCELLLAVGNGALLLARAGLLRDATVAIPDEVADELSEIEPTATRSVGARVLEHERLMTAERTGAATELALASVARVLGKKQAEIVIRTLGLPVPDAPVELTRIEVD